MAQQDLNRTANLVKLKIFLDGDSFECLLNHVPRRALSRDAINEAVLLGNTRVIDCDDIEARDPFGSRSAPLSGCRRQNC